MNNYQNSAVLDPCMPRPFTAENRHGSGLYSLAGLIAQCHAEVCVLAVGTRPDALRVEIAHRDVELEPSLRERLLGSDMDDPIRTLRAVITRGETAVIAEPRVWMDDPLQRDADARPGLWVAVPLTDGADIVGGMLLRHAGASGEDRAALVEATEHFGARLGRLIAESNLAAEDPRGVQTRDEMLGLVAHDLRNPLNLIRLSSELMLERLPAEEAFFRKWLGAIVHATERMDRVVGDLLEVTRLEHGTPTVTPAPIAANLLLREAVDDHTLHAQQKGVQLELEEASAEDIVLADVDALSRVFSNLLDNALKFTPAGGRITIRAVREGQHLRIEVEDTGSGIDPAQLPRIFDRFWQARTNHRAGAGLGLAIAMGIVEAHGGRIWATSKLGAGTTFHFTLPLA